jgi:hypothetical protein
MFRVKAAVSKPIPGRSPSLQICNMRSQLGAWLLLTCLAAARAATFSSCTWNEGLATCGANVVAAKTFPAPTSDSSQA